MPPHDGVVNVTAGMYMSDWQITRHHRVRQTVELTIGGISRKMRPENYYSPHSLQNPVKRASFTKAVAIANSPKDVRPEPIYSDLMDFLVRIG